MSTATIIMLPTAASAPVVNPKRSGRLPGSIPTLSGWRRTRNTREMAANERHASQIYEGLLVRVCRRTSPNYGRVGRVVTIGTDRALCVLTPIGGPFVGLNGALTDVPCVRVADIEPQAQAALRAFAQSAPERRPRSSRATDEVNA